MDLESLRWVVDALLIPILGLLAKGGQELGQVRQQLVDLQRQAVDTTSRANELQGQLRELAESAAVTDDARRRLERMESRFRELGERTAENTAILRGRRSAV